MYPATTFTNNGTTAGTKQLLNLVTWKSGVHCNTALLALLHAAYQAYNHRTTDSGANYANIYRYPRTVPLDILQGTACLTGSGEISRYVVDTVGLCAFAGTGNPTNATGIEGFVLKIMVGTSGSDAISASYEFFVPFYTLRTAIDLTAVPVGNILASA